MGIGNRTLPAIAPTVGRGGSFADMSEEQLTRLEGSSSVMGQAIARAARAAQARRAGPAVSAPPVVDPSARAAAARQAADRTRRRAAGAPVLNLNPQPGTWRTY